MALHARYRPLVSNTSDAVPERYAQHPAERCDLTAVAAHTGALQLEPGTVWVSKVRRTTRPSDLHYRQTRSGRGARRAIEDCVMCQASGRAKRRLACRHSVRRRRMPGSPTSRPQPAKSHDHPFLQAAVADAKNRVAQRRRLSSELIQSRNRLTPTMDSTVINIAPRTLGGRTR